MRKTMALFKPETVSTTVLVDLLGYDCWPALASLEAIPLGFGKERIESSCLTNQENR